MIDHGRRGSFRVNGTQYLAAATYASWVNELGTVTQVTTIIDTCEAGSFIDDLAFMVLATPIFFPAVIKLGFDPLWVGMMVGITVMIGVVIPPVAINVFVVRNITKVPFSVIYSGVYPFLLSILFCAVLLFLFPPICTFLPDLLMK